MKCPHCKKALKLENYVENNVYNYNSAALAKTLCCGKGVHVHPVRSVEVFAYTGDKKYDDWGKVFGVKEKENK